MCAHMCLQIVIAQASDKFCVIQKFVITASADSKIFAYIWFLISQSLHLLA